jgi:transcription antitermination factor NusG
MSDKKWFVVHAYSGFEKSVQRALTERIKRSELGDQFGKILVPVEEVVEMKNGAKAISERKFFPGYVLVEMEMTDGRCRKASRSRVRRCCSKWARRFGSRKGRSPTFTATWKT